MFFVSANWPLGKFYEVAMARLDKGFLYEGIFMFKLVRGLIS